MYGFLRHTSSIFARETARERISAHAVARSLLTWLLEMLLAAAIVVAFFSGIMLVGKIL